MYPKHGKLTLALFVEEAWEAVVKITASLIALTFSQFHGFIGKEASCAHASGSDFKIVFLLKQKLTWLFDTIVHKNIFVITQKFALCTSVKE